MWFASSCPRPSNRRRAIGGRAPHRHSASRHHPKQRRDSSIAPALHDVLLEDDQECLRMLKSSPQYRTLTKCKQDAQGQAISANSAGRFPRNRQTEMSKGLWLSLPDSLGCFAVRSFARRVRHVMKNADQPRTARLSRDVRWNSSILAPSGLVFYGPDRAFQLLGRGHALLATSIRIWHFRNGGHELFWYIRAVDCRRRPHEVRSRRSRQEYITATRWLTRSTTAISWEMNRKASVEALLQVEHQVDNLRLDRDVERRDTLISDDDFGLERQRPCDTTRCRWPPENSCG